MTIVSVSSWAGFTDLMVYNTQPQVLVVDAQTSELKNSDALLRVLELGGAKTSTSTSYGNRRQHWSLVTAGNEGITFTKSAPSSNTLKITAGIKLETLDIVRSTQLSFRNELAKVVYGAILKGGATYTEDLNCLSYAPNVCGLRTELKTESLSCLGVSTKPGTPTQKPVVDNFVCYFQP